MINKYFRYLSITCLLFGLLSCEKIGGDGSYLEGTYILQRVDIDFMNGQSIIYDEKEDFSTDNDIILFDYEYQFEKDGSYSFRGAHNEKIVSGCTYSIKKGVLSLTASPFFGIELNAYKIISNSGNTLVLEPTEAALEANNDLGELLGLKPIKKTVGTYKKQ